MGYPVPFVQVFRLILATFNTSTHKEFRQWEIWHIRLSFMAALDTCAGVQVACTRPSPPAVCALAPSQIHLKYHIPLTHPASGSHQRFILQKGPRAAFCEPIQHRSGQSRSPAMTRGPGFAR